MSKIVMLHRPYDRSEEKIDAIVEEMWRDCSAEQIYEALARRFGKNLIGRKQPWASWQRIKRRRAS